MKMVFEILGHTYEVSCNNINGADCNKWGNTRKRFRVGIAIDGGDAIKFYYHDSIANYPRALNENGLKNAFYCYVSDASSICYCRGQLHPPKVVGFLTHFS